MKPEVSAQLFIDYSDNNEIIVKVSFTAEAVEKWILYL